jgi:phenylacetic acid degradation operon negative regulatory protein
LLARQRRQDEAMQPRVREWDGTWTTLVVTSVGTDARARSTLRTTLHQQRFAELREGVWIRPDNLDMHLDAALGADIRARLRVLAARDDDPAELAARLWDLPGWASTGERLLAAMAAADNGPDRFVTAAAIVRHLLSDPVLPDGLLPAGWPGARLRAVYSDFAAEFSTRRRQTQLMEAR